MKQYLILPQVAWIGFIGAAVAAGVWAHLCLRLFQVLPGPSGFAMAVVVVVGALGLAPSAVLAVAMASKHASVPAHLLSQAAGQTAFLLLTASWLCLATPDGGATIGRSEVLAMLPLVGMNLAGGLFASTTIWAVARSFFCWRRSPDPERIAAAQGAVGREGGVPQGRLDALGDWARRRWRLPLAVLAAIAIAMLGFRFVDCTLPAKRFYQAIPGGVPASIAQVAYAFPEAVVMRESAMLFICDQQGQKAPGIVVLAKLGGGEVKRVTLAVAMLDARFRRVVATPEGAWGSITADLTGASLASLMRGGLPRSLIDEMLEEAR
ncbi:MAG: hypothetical protein K2Q20_03785, partial [Phycisphaerales bacterium]|nr:hypothetical protein [Phycisphaerales bacterium]